MNSGLRSSSPRSLSRMLCSTCLRTWTQSRPTIASRSIGLQNNDRIRSRSKSYIAEPGGQAKPIEGFYAELLSKPLSKVQPLTRTAPKPPPADSLPKTDKEETLEKARIVFGSRLAGPAERKAHIEAASRDIAGVMVPPKPTEPDNCCMSGCVNCVWDVYRDEMEAWAVKMSEARAAIQAQRSKGTGTGSMVAEEGMPQHVATSMDDDGGGSETNWDVSVGASSADLFDDIPVGIREFMKTEKMLRQKHTQEDTLAG